MRNDIVLFTKAEQSISTSCQTYVTAGYMFTYFTALVGSPQYGSGFGGPYAIDHMLVM